MLWPKVSILLFLSATGSQKHSLYDKKNEDGTLDAIDYQIPVTQLRGVRGR